MRMTRIAISVCAVALCAFAACSHGTATSSGRTVRTVEISDLVKPGVMYASPGDEVRWMNAREQPSQRRLAGSRRADDGDPLAWLEVEIEAVQHVAPVDVGVAHVRRPQPLVLGLLPRRLAAVRNLRDAHQPRE